MILMPTEQRELTREETRDVLKRQRDAYELMELQRLREPWREPTLEEKLAFDRLMADVNRTRGPSRPCGMVEWYRKLSRREQ
jgi:hypothetical protein